MGARSPGTGQAAQAQAEAAQAQDEAARAQREARTCPMTGLPNYLAYLEEAEELQAEARRTGTPVAVVFLDLDQFGTINKTFSWDQGTRTLAAVADVLESECRGHDRVFRFGGEEFVVLLPGTDRHGAGVVAERLRAAVEAAAIPHGGLPELPIVTLSVGVAAGRGPDPGDRQGGQEGRRAVAAREGHRPQPRAAAARGLPTGQRCGAARWRRSLNSWRRPVAPADQRTARTRSRTSSMAPIPSTWTRIPTSAYTRVSGSVCSV